MLCLRSGKATPDSFLRLARIFGSPQRELMGVLRDTAYPEISLIERRQGLSTATGKAATFGGHWHTDDSYMAVPCAATLLYGEVVPPEGGDTSFANMRLAYEALADETRARIAGLKAVHTYQSRRNRSPVPARTPEEEARTPPVTHPLVRTHPETGRKALYINPNRIDRIADLALNEGDALLDALIEHATQPAFVTSTRGSRTTSWSGTIAARCTGLRPTRATTRAACSASSSKEGCRCNRSLQERARSLTGSIQAATAARRAGRRAEPQTCRLP